MDSAIHYNTGKEYYAWQIWKKGLFKNNDVHKEKWIVPSDRIENYDELEDKEILCTPVISHQRGQNRIPSFFRLITNNEKIIFVQETEKHKKLKTAISILFTEEFNCKLKYDKEKYFIKELPIDYDKLQKNIKKLEVRKNITTTKEHKIADVLIPFIFNPFWGNGLVIEIRVTETEDTEEEKENFWFQRGYSIIWLDEKDFITEKGRLGLNKNIIEVTPFSIGYKKILDNHINEMHSYLNEGWDKLEEEKKCVDKNIHYINYLKHNFLKNIEADLNRLRKTCRTCKHGRPDSRNEELIACWYHTHYTKNRKKAPSKREKCDGCENHAYR